MEKLLASVIAVSSIAAFGAWEKAATVRIAEPEVIMMTVGHVGNHIGNPMIGMMAASMIKDVPKGCIVYCDGREAEIAVVSPSTEEGKKWNISSDNEEVKALAVKDIDSVLASTGTQALVIDVESAGIVNICNEVEPMLASLSGDEAVAAKQIIELVKEIAHASVGVEVDETGVALKSNVKIQAGSNLDKLCKGTIPADAWEKVDAKSLFAIFSASNTGSKEDQKRAVDFVAGVFAKHGIDKFFTIKSTEAGYADITVDFGALVAEAKAEQSKFAAFDMSGFSEDMNKFQLGENARKLIKDTNDPSGCGIILKGWTPAATPKARFEATLPELKNKDVLTAFVGSFYSGMLAIKPIALAEIPAERRQQIEPIVKMLPAEGVGGIAYAAYREGNDLNGILRVSSDEIKGIAAVVTAVIAFEASNDADDGDCDCEDEDDEDDEDDEEE